MAYIAILSTTESSITVEISGADTAYDRADRVCTWYLNGAYSGTSKIGASVTAGGTYTFSGLKAGTTYSISVSVKAPNWLQAVEMHTSAKTDSPSIQLWSWSDSNGNASAAQTHRAYSSITSKGSLGDFSYLVWNDLVDKAKEVLDAKGKAWDNGFASFGETKMNAGDKKLRAARFNSLRYNIDTLRSTGIGTIRSGDTVYGWYFTTFANCINGAIS